MTLRYQEILIRQGRNPIPLTRDEFTVFPSSVVPLITAAETGRHDFPLMLDRLHG